jgi:hypothetical protein
VLALFWEQNYDAGFWYDNHPEGRKLQKNDKFCSKTLSP